MYASLLLNTGRDAEYLISYLAYHLSTLWRYACYLTRLLNYGMKVSSFLEKEKQNLPVGDIFNTIFDIILMPCLFVS